MMADPLPLPRPYYSLGNGPQHPHPAPPRPQSTPRPRSTPRPQFTPHSQPVWPLPAAQRPAPGPSPARPAPRPATARQAPPRLPVRRCARLARAVIGDELRIPIMWCEFGTCIERYTHVDALGERDLRGRALAAGWRYDLLGRLACPSCVQRDERFRMTRPPVPARRFPRGGTEGCPAVTAHRASELSGPGWTPLP